MYRAGWRRGMEHVCEKRFYMLYYKSNARDGRSFTPSKLGETQFTA